MDRTESGRNGAVTLLMFDALGGGGVARAVTNLANLLVEHREVRVISLFRRRGDRPGFPLDPRVSLEFLVDLRTPPNRLQRMLGRRSSRLRPATGEERFSLLTDLRLARRLRAIEAGVLISTRPSLHLAATRWAPRGVRLIGQDHGTFATRVASARQAALLDHVIPKLDTYVVLTRADAEAYRRRLPQMTTRVEFVPNALPWPMPIAPASLDAKVILAAGRLTKRKAFGRLVRAFEPVARAHPDWQLHVYGTGPEHAGLDRLIRSLGLDSQVVLKGHVRDFASVLRHASVFALTSRTEGFSMVLIEAMSAGLPVVSYDCPQGPREIIDHTKNGFLIPDGDRAGFSSALLELVENEDLRRRTGHRAHESARAYSPDIIVEEWLTITDRLRR